MADEARRVDAFIRKNEKKALREMAFKAIQSRLRLYFMRYAVPASGNRYLVFWFDPGDPAITRRPYCGAALLHADSRGRTDAYFLRKIDGVVDSGAAWRLQRFTPHFFTRYRERSRAGSAVSTDELMARAIGKNVWSALPLDASKMNFRSEKYPGAVAFQIFDGVSLGSRKTLDAPGGRRYDVLTHHTFLPQSMMGDNQMRQLVTADNIGEFLTVVEDASRKNLPPDNPMQSPSDAERFRRLRELIRIAVETPQGVSKAISNLYSKNRSDHD